ncbi:MAG: LysR family transcriptional regulator [Bacteroidales bacterium]|nr:LysR family transcriptional regulator [Candidatus Cryptobacteroides aphodequi]
MELRQLKYFVTLSRTLNFSEAARKLFITQGTLSQQIMQLEGELGVKLFTRGPHNVSITEAGEELLPLAIQTLNDSESCQKRMLDLKKALCGSLSIGVTHSFGALLTDTVKSFLKAYPGVKLNIHYKTATELIDMLHRKEVDFILAFKPVQVYEKMESEVLFTSRLSAVMRREHPLADRPFITLAELKKQGIALPGSGLQARRTFERFVDVDSSKMNVRIELNDPNIILDILQGTNLIAILSSLAVHYRPSLVAIPIEGIDREMLGCVHYLKDAYRKRSAEIFIDMLRDSAMVERIRMKM